MLIDEKLNAPIPRPTRFTRMAWRIRICYGIVTLVVVSFLSIQADRNISRLRAFRDHGRVTQATIVNRYCDRTSRIDYRYRAGNAMMQASSDVSTSYCNSVERGTTFEITYLPSSPGTVTLDRITPDVIGETGDTWAIGIVLIAIAGLLAFAVLEWRLYNKRFLLSHGAPNPATVIGKSIGGQGQRYIIYRYTIRTREFTQANEVPKQFYAAVAVGDSITALYDPEEPSQCLLYGAISELVLS